MNKLTTDKRVSVIKALVEGCSIRSTVRMTGVAKNTVLKLLVDVGRACEKYQHEVMRNLPCQRLEVDEIWSFVYAKQRNIPASLQNDPGIGDVWTFVAIDSDTKLVPAWTIGARDASFATLFLHDVASRLSNRIQLTTDGHKMYLVAAESAFGGAVDYAMLIKVYGHAAGDETRYSPGECIDCEAKRIAGFPNPDYISTSFVERQNLTMRMRMRRFTRLTNAFSKKMENHEHSVALHFMHYNFCRVHQTLRCTPAMKAKVTDHIWTMEEVIALVD